MNEHCVKINLIMAGRAPEESRENDILQASVPAAARQAADGQVRDRVKAKILLSDRGRQTELSP